MRSNLTCLEDRILSLRLAEDPSKNYLTKKMLLMRGEMKYSQSIKKFIVHPVSFQSSRECMRSRTCQQRTRTNSGSATRPQTSTWENNESCLLLRARMSKYWMSKQLSNFVSSITSRVSSKLSLKRRSKMSISKTYTKNSCPLMPMTSSPSIHPSRIRKAPKMRRLTNTRRMLRTNSEKSKIWSLTPIKLTLVLSEWKNSKTSEGRIDEIRAWWEWWMLRE